MARSQTILSNLLRLMLPITGSFFFCCFLFFERQRNLHRLYYYNIERSSNHMENEVVFKKIEDVLSYLNKERELQKLASENGLDVKNTIRLTQDSIDRYLVSVISLLLAQQSSDPRYKTLVQTGVSKRTLKAEIINNYKNQAIQLINQYKNDNKDDRVTI